MNYLLKKRSYILIIAAVMLFTATLFYLSGCGDEIKVGAEVKINAINSYKDFPNNPIKIHVVFDDELYGEFDITDESNIKRIYIKVKEAPAPRTNRYMTFYYSDDNQISFGTWVIVQNGSYFHLKTSDTLDSILQEIGLEQGKLFER